MNRLTRKIKGCYCIDLITCLPMEYEQINKGNACVEKLGKLEDIEEELGIDLITLFEILEQGYVYTTDFNKRMEKWYFQCIEGINKTTLGRKYLEIVFNENEDLEGCASWVPDWRDYGKTWSLDKNDLIKEELENE